MLRESRRIGPRTRVHLPIQLRLQEECATQEIELKDMGSGGLAFIGNVDLREGAPVEVIIAVPFEISLTETIHVRLQAEVLRVEVESEVGRFSSALQFLGPVN